MIRHFTATGFVISGGATLLHWHRRVGGWLPPGGHVEPNEDPVQAVLREILEETGIAAEVALPAPDLGAIGPAQIPPPVAILVEDIRDGERGDHQHIDMIYFCRPAGASGPLRDGWRWVSRADLAAGVALGGHGGPPVPPPADVRALAERAFSAIEDGGG